MASRHQLPVDFKPWDKGIPTRENCDLTNPYEAFLWVLVAPPMMNGAPLVGPIDWLQLWSKQIWDAGCRPDAAAPVIAYRPPQSGDQNWMRSPGEWGPIR